MRRNVVLRDAPTAAAEKVYAGVLYGQLALAELDSASADEPGVDRRDLGPLGRGPPG